METMTVERVISAPVEEVFAWLTTTTHYTRSPLVLRCRLTRRGESAPYGVGAVRSHLWLIGWFRERITHYDPPHATEYVVERSLPPSRHELGRMTFTEVDGGTQVCWTTRAEIPVPLVGARPVGQPRCPSGPARRIRQNGRAGRPWRAAGRKTARSGLPGRPARRSAPRPPSDRASAWPTRCWPSGSGPPARAARCRSW
ncbi:Polyketide cyclase / dehydrase and lipid transport [Streptomyces sp. 2314.4]|nr:Polyketide cyclase / dehydrase and lipid transport [Streptomyces sp. 2314.4]